MDHEIAADEHAAEGQRILSTAIALAEGGNVPGELLLTTPEQRAIMARELASVAGSCFGAARYHAIRMSIERQERDRAVSLSLIEQARDDVFPADPIDRIRAIARR